MRLLLLEDETDLRLAFGSALRGSAFAVDEVGTLHEARHALTDPVYDCVVLDRLVPDGDALDLAVELQRSDQRPAVLCISALNGNHERVEALASGADDFVAKPVHLDELVLRVGKLLLRHTSAVSAGGPLRLGRASVDRERKEVTIDGTFVHLTATEYQILDYLVANYDRMVPTLELQNHCWDSATDNFSDVVHPHISRLRRKFNGVVEFVMHRNEGYLLRVMDDPTN